MLECCYVQHVAWQVPVKFPRIAFPFGGYSISNWQQLSCRHTSCWFCFRIVAYFQDRFFLLWMFHQSQVADLPRAGFVSAQRHISRIAFCLLWLFRQSQLSSLVPYIKEEAWRIIHFPRIVISFSGDVLSVTTLCLYTLVRVFPLCPPSH